MRPTSRAIILNVFIVVSALVSAPSVKADLFGLKTDPLGLGDFSKGIQKSIILAQQLLSQGNTSVADRLDQIKGIIELTLAGGKEITSEVFAKVKDLQISLKSDVKSMLRDTECVAVKVLDDHFQVAVKNAINNISDSKLGVKVGGITLAELRGASPEKTPNITDHYAVYLETRRVVYEDLKAKVNENSPAYLIPIAYQTLELAAKKTMCHYQNMGLEDVLVDDIADYRELFAPWREAIALNWHGK